MVRIHGNADIIALESRNYEELVRPISPYEVLVNSARQFGARDAIRFLHSGDVAEPFDTFSYQELLSQVRRAANAFHRLGVVPGKSVAFLLPSIPQAYFTLFGAETAGQACPINYLLAADHIAELLAAAQAHVLVVLGPDPRLDIWSKVAGIQARAPWLKHVLTVGTQVTGYQSLEALMAEEIGEQLNFAPPASRDALAAYFHTGGTTAAPKLAQHTQGNQVHVAWGASLMYAMSEADVVINGFPLFHVAGSFVYGLSALISGATIVLPTLLGMRDAGLVRNYWKVVEHHGVTLLAGVPTVIATLLELAPGESNLSRVRCMLTGGSPLPTELANQFEARFGIPVRNILGMTECAGVISITPFHAPRVPGSCGLALPFTRIKVVRVENEKTLPDQECAPGETGVVLIKGPNVSPGYTEAKRNAGTFTRDGWLISGDLGFISASGELHLSGRAKDLIIRSSHNIDPAYIEEALLKHPAVQMAAAVGQPDEYAGELPMAFVTLLPGHEISTAALIEFAAPLIPERPAIPKRVVVIENMPLTPIGKIFKPALRRMAIEGVLQERIATRFAPAERPTLKMLEEGSSFKARFTLASAGTSAIARERISALMAPFALQYEITENPTVQ